MTRWKQKKNVEEKKNLSGGCFDLKAKINLCLSAFKALITAHKVCPLSSSESGN